MKTELRNRKHQYSNRQYHQYIDKLKHELKEKTNFVGKMKA